MEVGRLVEHEAVAVAENVGREPTVQPQAARADDRGESALHQRLSGLEVLAGDGHLRLFGQFPHGGDVHRGVGRTHHEGRAFGQGGVGITHRGRDALGVVGLHGRLEVGQTVVHRFVHRHIDFGRSRPEHHHALTAVVGFEAADVFAQRLDHVPARGAVFHVVAVQTRGIALVESGGHGANGLQLVFNGEDVFGAQHFGVHSALKGVGGVHVPSTEHQVVERGQRDDVGILQIFLVGTAPHADFIVLCHCTDRLGQAFTRHEHAGDEGCADRAEADDHHTQFSICWFHVGSYDKEIVMRCARLSAPKGA